MKKIQLIYITLSLVLVILSLVWFFKDNVFKKEDKEGAKSDENLDGASLATGPTTTVDTTWEEVETESFQAPTPSHHPSTSKMVQPPEIRPTTIKIDQWDELTKTFHYTIVHRGQLVKGEFAPGHPPVDQPIAGGRLLVVQGLLPPKEIVEAAIQPDVTDKKGKISSTARKQGKLNIELSTEQKVAVVKSNQYASHKDNQPLLDQLSELHHDFGGVLSEFALILVFDTSSLTQAKPRAMHVLDFDDGMVKKALKTPSTNKL